jgi:protein-L-isoaspartate(D-aspartate) O-methyltransferase
VDFEQARVNMIKQQIQPWNVLSTQVLDSLALVKRERFVPEDKRSLAFAEIQMPIGKGQCMLEPKIEARILQALAMKGNESVLEIGSGSGYMAALLAAHAEWVRTLEIDADLARQAQANLDHASVSNVIVIEADGTGGHPERAPFDVIVASGAVRSVPQAWLDQLKPGGKLFAFVGTAPVLAACLITKQADGSTRSETIFESDVPSLAVCTPADRAFVL